MSFFHRIRTRLALAFLLVTLLPTLIVGVYSMQVSSKSLRERELNAQGELVSGHARDIVAFLGTVRSDILFLSDSIPLRSYLSLHDGTSSKGLQDRVKRQLAQEFYAFSTRKQIYHQVRYLDENGQEIVRVDRTGDASSIREDKTLQNKASRYYFKDSVGLAPGEVFVSPLDLNREQGKVEKPHKPVIRYAVPVHYPGGERAGIVIVNVNANGFLKGLGNTMLVDRDGYFLAHPQKEKAWGSPRDLNTGHNLRKEYSNEAGVILTQAAGNLESNGQVFSFQRVTIPGSDQYWSVVTSRSLDDLLADVRNFRLNFGIILGLALLVALLLALFLDSKITRPIETLTRLADKVSTGELFEPVEIQDQGEIGKLAEAFERMRVSMIKMMDRMRRRRA